MNNIQYGDGSNNRFSYEETMREREMLREIEGINNLCPFLNEQFKNRCCPSDGISKCEDCPLK